MLIFILIFLILIFNKNSFKKILLINDIIHFEFIYIMIFIFNKIKNIVKITKCYFLKIDFVFDIFFDINLMIKQSRFTKYVASSIFFCSLIIILLLLTKIIVKFVIMIINVILKLSLKLHRQCRK